MGNNFDPMKLASITASELSARLAAESGLTLIDVRTPAEFAELHAAPARNLPLPDVSPAALAALGHADASAPVYVLCQSGKRAESACARLSSAGFAKAVVVTGGTEAWAAAGLPVVRGQGSAIGIERQVRIGAGALVVLGVVLAQTVHANFVWLSAFVGAGLVFAGVTGFCGMGLLLAKAPWNRA
jgi:rhodanese-related sulfurtransferase